MRDCSIGNQKKWLSASLCQDFIVTPFWFRKKHDTSRLQGSGPLLKPCRVRSKLVAFRQLLIVLNVLNAPFQGFILFLFSSQLCCGGKIIQSYGPSSQCCGYLAYNSQTSFCYGGSIYKKCQYKSYDPASFVCCDKTLVLRHGGNNTRCCGQKSYDR